MGSSAIVFAMIAVAVLLFGLWVGFRQGRADVQNQLRNEEAKYAQMKAGLDAAFKGAAADALRANTESFLALAKQELGGQTKEANLTLEAKELAIKNLLDPLGKALKSLDDQTREMEVKRSGAYSEVKTLVENIQNSIPASLDALKNETAQLITALRAPKTRGNWGEHSTAERARNRSGCEDATGCLSGCQRKCRSSRAEDSFRCPCPARESAFERAVGQGLLEAI